MKTSAYLRRKEVVLSPLGPALSVTTERWGDGLAISIIDVIVKDGVLDASVALRHVKGRQFAEPHDAIVGVVRASAIEERLSRQARDAAGVGPKIPTARGTALLRGTCPIRRLRIRPAHDNLLRGLVRPAPRYYFLVSP